MSSVPDASKPPNLPVNPTVPTAPKWDVSFSRMAKILEVLSPFAVDGEEPDEVVLRLAQERDTATASADFYRTAFEHLQGLQVGLSAADVQPIPNGLALGTAGTLAPQASFDEILGALKLGWSAHMVGKLPQGNIRDDLANPQKLAERWVLPVMVGLAGVLKTAGECLGATQDQGREMIEEIRRGR